MTSQDHRHQRRLDDEHSVDALLAESGFQDDAELREMLLQIRGLRTLDVPPPSAALAALMDQDASPGDVVRPLAPAARKRNRAVFTSLAVAASLGIAGGAAAGNESLRHSAEGTISSVVGWLLAPAPIEPPPAVPSEAPAAPAAVVPHPVPTPPPGSPPAGLAPDTGPVQSSELPAAGPGIVPARPLPGPRESHSEPPAVLPDPAGNRPDVPGQHFAPGNPESTGKDEGQPPATTEAPGRDGGAAAGKQEPGKPGPANQPPPPPRNPDPR